MIYGGSGRSTPQRIMVQVLQTVLAVVGIWLLLRGHGDSIRRWLLVASFGVVYLRFTLTVLYLVKRTIGWQEAMSIPFAFAMYFLGFSLLGRDQETSVGALGYAGIALFVIGSATNTVSELLRDRWKADPANRGKLYTGGLFRYALHINYFGDVLWVLGIALMTGNFWSLIIPVALFCFFAFMNGPMLDRHLLERYGEAFKEYAARTAKIIPFVF